MFKRKYIILIALLISAQVASAVSFDHAPLDQLLKAYVDDQGLVDYRAMAKDPRFQAYMDSLKTAAIEDMTRNGQLAFWINAYNAVTIDKVIRWKPKKSVRETFIPGLWTSTEFFTSREHIVANKKMSQDDIEHEILRKQLKDPRIHFAIVCASSSCPKLQRFAFSAEDIQAQLESETRRYINSERGTRIDRAENTLYLSKIFDWFAGDFENTSGSVLAYVKNYLDAEALSFLERDPKIAYLHYDWSLNAKEPLRYEEYKREPK